jgi:hypothetical protein
MFHSSNDVDREYYVPKRLRKPSGVFGYIFPLLTAWVTNITHQVSKLPTPAFLSSSRLERRLKFRHRQRILSRHTGSSNTPRRRSKLLSLLAYSAVCMATETMLVQAQSATGSFDTDSKPIGIDNRCTACISHDETDFIGGITASNRWIKGFGGSKTTNVKTGTLRWSLEDDDGKAHTFLIPNSYFVQQGGVGLLSPQHWARTQADPVTRGTGSETTSKQVERTMLEYDRGSYPIMLLGWGRREREREREGESRPFCRR